MKQCAISLGPAGTLAAERQFCLSIIDVKNCSERIHVVFSTPGLAA
jgi:hypothetical protein